MADEFVWVPPTLIYGPVSEEAKARNPGRQNFSAAGAGTGIPVIHISLSPFTVVEGAANATVVGALAVDPVDTTLSLTNSAGGLFALSGSNIVTTSTPTVYPTNKVSDIIVTGTWGGRSVPVTLEIDVTQAPYVWVSTTLSGGHSIAHTAAAGTLLGTLSSSPSAGSHTITYAILGGGTTGNWALVGAAVNVGVGANAAGSYNLQIQTLVDGVGVNTQVIAITVS